MPLTIFFCYASEDQLLLDQLKNHLKPLQRQGFIDGWYDRMALAGTEWKQEAKKHLNGAQIILLLVSPSFLASDYSYDVEVKQAIERHEAGETHVIPIILRPVIWEETLFGHLQPLPTQGKPVVSWANPDEAFLDVAKHVQKVIEEHLPNLSPPSNPLLTQQAPLEERVEIQI